MSSSEQGDLVPWTIHGERTIYDNRWIRLGLVDVEPPGVARFEHHVVHLDAAAIALVIDEQDRVLMLWRYRFVANKWAWELPGGLVDKDEDVTITAAREVEEETGWRPTSLHRVVSYQPIVGMVDAPHEILIGRGATFVGEPTDTEEAGRVEWIPLSEIPEMIGRGELISSGSLIGLLHVLAFGANSPRG